MDVYVLDKDLSIVSIIDSYNSLIWTERYAEAGDFELRLPASVYYVEIIQQDRYLKIKDSNELMIIESISINTENRTQYMTVTGRSLISILDRRVVLGSRYFNSENLDCATNGQNLWQIVSAIVTENVINPSSNPINDITSDNHLIEYHNNFRTNREISSIVLGFTENVKYDPYGKIASSNPDLVKKPVDVQFNGETIYDAVKSICDKYHIGFKIIYDPTTPQTPFRFYIYDGQNRIYNNQPKRTDNSFNSPVILSPKFDNIANISYSSSKKGFKNVMLSIGDVNKTGNNHQSWAVINSEGNEITSGSQSDEYKGLNLRESIQDLSSEVTYDGTDGNGTYHELTDSEYHKILVSRAVDILKDQNKALEAFDGEVINNVRYKVKEDYDLGDIIEMNDNLGHSRWMRITEIIYSNSNNGYKIYPTLAVYEKDDWQQRD